MSYPPVPELDSSAVQSRPNSLLSSDQLTAAGFDLHLLRRRIPLTLTTAIAVLTDGKVADVDLGQAGNNPFANLVSFGVSAQVASHVPAGLKRLIGRAAYPLTALTRLPGHRAFHTGRRRALTDAPFLATGDLWLGNRPNASS